MIIPLKSREYFNLPDPRTCPHIEVTRSMISPNVALCRGCEGWLLRMPDGQWHWDEREVEPTYLAPIVHYYPDELAPVPARSTE